MRKILVRFDDICPTMDWNQWNRAMKILKLYHVKPLIGVIPDCQDPDLLIDLPRRDFWDYLKALQADGFAIAMHGYLHLYDTNAQGIVMVHPFQSLLDTVMRNSMKKSGRGKKYWLLMEFKQIFSLRQHIPMMKIL